MKDTILSQLKKVHSKNNGQYMACCPAHDDKNPSLSLKFLNDGRILINCYAGCAANDVLRAIDLSLSDLYPDGAIRTFMASASFNQRKDTFKDDILLEICHSDREQGKRQNRKCLQAEREAYLRTRK